MRLSLLQRKGYYSSMIDAFEEYRCEYVIHVLLAITTNLFYRCMKVELRHVSFVTGVDSGNVCPACPKVNLM